MKKMHAVIVSFVLVWGMIVGLPVSPAAASIVTGDMSDDFVLSNDIAEQIINHYKTDPNISYHINDSTQLLGFNGDLYTYYELLPYGFAILYNQTGSLMEAYFDSNYSLPIVCSKTDVIYYGGPGLYAINTGGNYVNLIDNEVVKLQAIASAENSQNSMHLLLSRTESIDISNEENRNARIISDPIVLGEERNDTVAYNYFSNLTDFGVNRLNTCDVIAASIVLGYYDVYINDDFVESEYRQGSGTSDAFHVLLNGYVYGISSPHGTYLSTVSKRLNHYLYDRGLNYKFTVMSNTQTAVIQKIIENIENDKPIIAAMHTNQGAIWNHGVVVYGVSYNTADVVGTAVFRCHMGWHHYEGVNVTNYLASALWFDVCSYIEQGNTVHRYSAWTSYDDMFHVHTCIPCNYTYYEPHDEYWNDHEGRCIRCNHTGSVGVLPTQCLSRSGIMAVCLCEQAYAK